MMELSGGLDNTMLRKEVGMKGGRINGGNLTATQFLEGERRSLMDIGSETRFGTYSGKESQGARRRMSFEDQRAAHVRRPTIGDHILVSVVIEEGWESHGDNHRKTNCRFMVSRGKKRWEDLWSKLKKL